MSKPLDLTGKRFGKLVVRRIVGTTSKGLRLWLCQCDCGKTTVVQSNNLNSGNTTSCGCKSVETRCARFPQRGIGKTRIHKVWAKMKERCYNPKCERYSCYGGRGISVCDEWKNDFCSFYEWAINNGYSDSLSIERVDVDGNYCPENCTWIPMKDQAKNRSTSRSITYNGETHVLSEWAEILGINASTLGWRIRQGWSLEKAFTKGAK